MSESLIFGYNGGGMDQKNPLFCPQIVGRLLGILDTFRLAQALGIGPSMSTFIDLESLNHRFVLIVEPR